MTVAVRNVKALRVSLWKKPPIKATELPPVPKKGDRFWASEQQRYARMASDPKHAVDKAWGKKAKVVRRVVTPIEQLPQTRRIPTGRPAESLEQLRNARFSGNYNAGSVGKRFLSDSAGHGRRLSIDEDQEPDFELVHKKGLMLSPQRLGYLANASWRRRGDRHLSPEQRRRQEMLGRSFFLGPAVQAVNNHPFYAGLGLTTAALKIGRPSTRTVIGQ